ncbi:MAG TPA: hypothetical protein ENK18_20730 [Deltaproteobacteria bacterium]|nr:hypothetical protein [Deltaproteobacteria bacterium]
MPVGVIGATAAGAAVSGGALALAAASTEVDPDNGPVAPPPTVEEIAPPALGQATSLPMVEPPGRTLTIQASDGMRVEVSAGGQSVFVVVDGDTFRIVDPTGLELAIGGN